MAFIRHYRKSQFIQHEYPDQQQQAAWLAAHPAECRGDATKAESLPSPALAEGLGRAISRHCRRETWQHECCCRSNPMPGLLSDHQVTNEHTSI